MKATLLKVSKNISHSFSARKDVSPDINNKWHYHQEVELVYFKSGTGTQFVGDRIKPFHSGDIVLIGPNLPHHFRFDDSYFDSKRELAAEVYVIHFGDDFWGKSFLNLPENRPLKELIAQSELGLHISGIKSHPAISLIKDIVKADGPVKIILLMQILLHIAEAGSMEPLASFGFKHNISASGRDRLQDIYNYSIVNFRRKIQLNTVAEIAGINPTSFCKYFKSRTRKTYSGFINEIRIGYACKLLLENKMSVKEICYESGYSNFTSFHSQFKNITGKSPLSYRRDVVGD
ncbi:AraC family transcriptional regulator [Arcticibacter sp.]|uniref:AraC family transcriptional regulator n=1 Tax=Arcticibacter sp. TaxID=1872630 RepID=UPI00388CF54E